MMALVGMRVWPFRRAQQRKAQNVTFGIVSILAIVEQAETMGCIGKIGPTLRRNFELGLLGRRITSCRALDGAIGDGECGLIAVSAERESDLQQNMFFMPFDLRLYIDA